MAHEESISLRSAIKSLFPDAWIDETARKEGFVRRQRKINAVPLFWTLVLGFEAGAERSVSALRRVFQLAAGVTLAPSAFYDRFNDRLVNLLKAAISKGLEHFAAAASDVHERLKRYEDVMLADSTLFKLHDVLADAFPGVRTNTIKAAAKLSVVLSVCGKGRSTVAVNSARTPEPRTISVGPWVAKRLLLFDRGYYCYTLFGNIARNAGYFLTRMKNHCNPIIVKVHRAAPGKADLLEGRPFKQAIKDLGTEPLDAEIEVVYRRRVQGVWKRRATDRYRLVGHYDHEDGKYYFYMTNIPVELLSPKDVYNVYRTRWEIELIFKELKSGYRLCGNRSRRKEVVETFIYSAVLTLIVSRRLLRAVTPLLGTRAERVTPSRWWRVFVTYAYDLLFVVTEHSRETARTQRLLLVLMHEVVDPHLRRRPLFVQDSGPSRTKRSVPKRRKRPDPRRSKRKSRKGL